jgi:hypothetical protein
MSDAALFAIIFGGLFVLRIIAATLVFAALLPKGDRCLHCDAPTVRIASLLWDRLLPFFRKSWCVRCGWCGLLRKGPIDAAAPVQETAGKRG